MRLLQISELDLAILAGTVVFLLFAGFITAYVIIYWKRKIGYAQEMEKMKTAFREAMLKSQLEIQEQTFNTISQEIHDNVGQTLSLAKVQVNIIDQSEATDRALLSEVRENIGKALADLRHLAKGLNSDHVQRMDLPDLIAPELKRLQLSGIAQTALEEEGTRQAVAQQKKLILFRIVQESLQNIVKHAEASAIAVKLHYGDDRLSIAIADDGKGFDTETADKNQGLGLQNIRNRAALIGGKADIESRPGAGTTVRLTIPYA